MNFSRNIFAAIGMLLSYVIGCNDKTDDKVPQNISDDIAYPQVHSPSSESTKLIKEDKQPSIKEEKETKEKQVFLETIVAGLKGNNPEILNMPYYEFRIRIEALDHNSKNEKQKFSQDEIEDMIAVARNYKELFSERARNVRNNSCPRDNDEKVIDEAVNFFFHMIDGIDKNKYKLEAARVIDVNNRRIYNCEGFLHGIVSLVEGELEHPENLKFVTRLNITYDPETKQWIVTRHTFPRYKTKKHNIDYDAQVREITGDNYNELEGPVEKLVFGTLVAQGIKPEQIPQRYHHLIPQYKPTKTTSNTTIQEVRTKNITTFEFPTEIVLSQPYEPPSECADIKTTILGIVISKDYEGFEEKIHDAEQQGCEEQWYQELVSQARSAKLEELVEGGFPQPLAYGGCVPKLPPYTLYSEFIQQITKRSQCSSSALSAFMKDEKTNDEIKIVDRKQSPSDICIPFIDCK